MIKQTFRTVATLCLLLSSAMLQAQHNGPDPNPHGQGRPFRSPTPEEREAARQRIGITTQQQNQIEQMVTDSNRKRKDLGGALHNLYHNLGELYDNYIFDKDEEKKLRGQITDIHSKLLKLHTETEETLRKILNKDQFMRMRTEMQSHRKERHHEDSGRGEHSPGPGGRPGDGSPGPS